MESEREREREGERERERERLVRVTPNVAFSIENYLSAETSRGRF